MCYLSSAEQFGCGLLFLFNVCAIDVIVGPWISVLVRASLNLQPLSTNISRRPHSQNSPTIFNPLPSSNQNASKYVNRLQTPGLTKRWRLKMAPSTKCLQLFLKGHQPKSAEAGKQRPKPCGAKAQSVRG